MGKSKKPHSVVAPCKDCQERKIGCHTDCERFSDYRKATEESKEQFDEYDKYKRNHHTFAWLKKRGR